MIRPVLPSLDTDRALRILLVDNDAEAAERSELALRAQLEDGLALFRVNSLDAAVRTLMEVPFDVVVLELDLPDATGIATLAGVRGAAAAVPIVVYSSLLDDALVLRAIRVGAHECLAKSSTPPDQLARSLAFAMERQRRLATIEAARSEAAHRATHDPLTGLANRNLILDQLDRALAFGSRYGRKTGIMFVDLDGFKEINDTLGHARGDALLQAVSRRLLESVRRSDTVARLGGDEFVVLLPDVTSRRDISFVQETIVDCLRAPIDVGAGQLVRVSASVGGAMSPLDGESASALMHAADADMYREKSRRRRPRALPTGLGEALTDGGSDALGVGPGDVRSAVSMAARVAAAASPRHPGEARMRAAYLAGEFEVYFQPILDSGNGKVLAAEALLRWNDPVKGLLLPELFLPLAEDTGLIVPIGEMVLQRACEAVVRWRATDALRDLRVAVNLAVVQLRENGFEQRLASILSESGCPPEALVLELSERRTLAEGEVELETLRALKALGVRLFVDDFGVGNASLLFLREAPIDGIKIDRQFVLRMLSDRRDHAIVSALVGLARGMSLEFVAEGVESAAQSNALRALGCDVQQGHQFCEAVPLADMEQWICHAERVRSEHAAGQS